MAAPRPTVWELEPHTRAKHELLKRYLQAWMIILSQGKFAEILYIDGFAGPGEYAGGEAGSPIIALDTALEFKPPLTAKVHFLFVEERDDRADHLRKQVALRTLPAKAEGDLLVEEIAHRIDKDHLRLTPPKRLFQPFGAKLQIETVFKRMTRHTSKAL
jgi:three-Cys-motif partner protein